MIAAGMKTTGDLLFWQMTKEASSFTAPAFRTMASHIQARVAMAMAMVSHQQNPIPPPEPAVVCLPNQDNHETASHIPP